jgi:hypothetical protein
VLSWEQLRQPLLATGVSSKDLDQAMTDLQDPAQWFTGPAMVAVWGQKPMAPHVDYTEGTGEA